MQRRSLSVVGAGRLSVALALFLWGLAVAPPAFSGGSERMERSERTEQVARGESAENAGHSERVERHDDGDHDEDGESDDLHGDDSLRCNGRQEIVRVEEKVCPPRPHRSAIVVKRACCRNPAGKVHCRGFRQCPNRSPS